MLFAHAWHTFQLSCLVQVLFSLGLPCERWGCNPSCQTDLSPHSLKIKPHMTVNHGRIWGRKAMDSLFDFCMHRGAALPIQTQTWDKSVPQANNHKGELCKTEGWRDGKGSFIHLFLNVFVDVVCIVLFNQYVPLLITFDQFSQWYRNSCSFKCTKWKWTQHKCFGHCNLKRKKRNSSVISVWSDSMFVCLCACVCVCVRERQREKILMLGRVMVCNMSFI